MSYTGRSLRHYIEQELGTLPHFIIYAVLEWTLIGLLFLDGFLAFISSEFADFFDLQAPCVLCTRIDHILARNKSWRYCYNETICDGHKNELSSLAYCHVHRKLSDIRTMCEGCLLSFATDNNNNNNNCNKSFNGGLNKDIEGLFDDEMRARLQLQPLWEDDARNGNANANLIYCSCCGERMKKAKPTGYQQQKGIGNISSKGLSSSSISNRLSQQAPTPSPRAPFASWRPDESRATLELSHIRCKELKSSETTTPDEEVTSSVTTPTASKDENKPMTPRPTEIDDSVEDFVRTPTFGRGNRFYGLSDSAAASPRFANRAPRKSLLEKVELASDPVEAITGNETDSELIMSRLKKQVRSDKKSLIALYMELDEERSASAVAANNAMAMITRLQAEKASVQMEALQYQRMMEEQAEYDKEDIQMLKDFLNKKEDEIRDLEAELDLYRDRYGLPHVTRGDVLEKSQSFSSITEHGSPLFSIVATDTEMEVQEHVSDKSSSASFYGEGENSGQKNDDEIHKEDDNDYDDDVGGSSHEGGQNSETQDVDDDGSFIEIEHEGSFLLGQLENLEVEDTP
ncbi:probable myosin-binding protein 5 [Beta vulgaris subsp. vulgaris]|uniref:probable myosin-binding protein 5 n=1 Tax=Beta vulgaris subsp. vulgaris TaxID=3555 RepID=UPI002036CEC0|nr:probable myosin-binding protein 5 [Beta vulgaris subsp. vulgaris]